MGIWNFESFGSDTAYEMLGAFDDMLVERRDATGLRVLLRIIGLPCVGFNRDGTPAGGSTRKNSKITATAILSAREWLTVFIEQAIRAVVPSDPTAELEAVAALATVAALRGVCGSSLSINHALIDRWSLWLTTGPATWTHDPRRREARLQVAAALLEGGMVPHSGIAGALMPHVP